MTSSNVTLDADELSPLLSMNEMAHLLGISRKTLYALIRRGDLVPIRVGERLRFEPAEVRSYLERNKLGPETREAGCPASEPLADEDVDEKPNAA
jgi:excisionase family DNA binding protein